MVFSITAFDYAGVVPLRADNVKGLIAPTVATLLDTGGMPHNGPLATENRST